jgi:hypothetical protein
VSGADAAGVDELVVEAARLLHAADRTDLAQRVSAAAARLRRPATVVCVVGEFKQGKSSLINALLGQSLCPVDDDLATSTITLVRYGEEATATVRRRTGSSGQPSDIVSEPVPMTDLHQWVTEAGNPANAKAVDRVEITTPSALLRQGLVVVDTPGMGGLGAGHAAATLAFLPFADGLVFVSDASAELSAPEVDFLRRATELCPTVLFAQTKIDLYPQWGRIAELNRGHLDRAGLSVPVVSVSSELRQEALRRKDRALNEASRIPEMVGRLGAEVVEPAKANAAQRSIEETLAALDQVSAGLRAQAALLEDPGRADEAIAALEDAKARLEHLRGPGAKWSVLVGDRVADLSNQVTHQFRSSFRSISKMMDERIETLSKGSEWDDLSRYLQTAVADEVTSVFVDLENGRMAIRAEVAELLQEEELDLATGAALTGSIDVADVWQAKALDPATTGGKKALGTVLTTARGAQGGIIMFGMLGSFLPAAAGLLLMSNPVLLGIGAVFGSVGLAEDRKRKIAARRQMARTQVRQFLDDVSFELGDQVGALVRDIQRQLRDDFGERITELLRTYTETAQRAQQDVQRSGVDREARLGEVSAQLRAIEQLGGRLRGVSS